MDVVYRLDGLQHGWCKGVVCDFGLDACHIAFSLVVDRPVTFKSEGTARGICYQLDSDGCLQLEDRQGPVDLH